MKKNGFLSLRIALALSVVLVCILWAVGQYSGSGESSVVSGPEDLRSELLWAQLIAVHVGGASTVYDAGSFVFVPGGDPDAEVFAEGLVPEIDGKEGWPVILFEDAFSHETVIVNGRGEEIMRLPPADGYAPSRIVMTALLLPPGSTAGGTGIRQVNVPAPSKSFLADVPSTGLAGGGAEDRSGLSPSTGSDAVANTDGANLPKSVQGSVTRTLLGVNLTLYADSDSGSVSHDGYSRFVQTNGVGPKATVQQAINAAVSGDTIELRGASAFADRTLTVGGKSLVLRPVGHVRF